MGTDGQPVNPHELQYPRYKNPPLTETVFSVNFEPIEGLHNGRLGLFWHEVKDDFPEAQHAPLIEPTTELFESTAGWPVPPLQFQLDDGTASRLQLKGESRHRLLQIQRDRVVYNWLKVENQEYPRFGQIFARFLHFWQKFEEFLENERLASPKLITWELVYVNHVERGKLWQTPADWHGVFPALFGDATCSPAGEPESVESHSTFCFREPNGRLHVETSKVHRLDESRIPALRLQLTARGMFTADLQFEQAYDAAHRMIVTSFPAFASDHANQYWGLQS